VELDAATGIAARANRARANPRIALGSPVRGPLRGVAVA